MPIGLIHSSWGGSRAEAWMRQDLLRKDPDFRPIVDEFERLWPDYEARKARFDDAFAAWEGGGRQGDRPRTVEPRPQYRAGHLFNGMVHPLLAYRIRGVIWYQGEANRQRGWQYRRLFPALIRDWRKQWDQGKFPFYYVQIAPFRYDPKIPNAPELREAQLMALKVPKTGMAVTMDIGNPEDVHPRNKAEVGRRLALWALAKTYGKKSLAYSGPLYKKMKIEKDRVRIRFDHAKDGLMAKGGELTWFSIAGADRKFVPAQAQIDGNTVVVHSPEVPDPRAVRFGWSNIAEPNLYNRAGLPASPFRTDDWPGVTFMVRK